MHGHSSVGSKVCLHTHGCKLNQAESEAIALQLAGAGYHITDSGPADVLVLNTCTVTHVADRKARQWLRQARRQNPESLIVATGCYVERAASELGQLGVDITCGNRDKPHLARIIADRLGAPGPDGLSPGYWRSRARSFVKVQDGCHGGCTYCIVPRVRPHVSSEPPDRVVAEIKLRTALGRKEVVLTGTEIGNYRYLDFDLKDLVKRVLVETSLERLRLSSLQPEHITREILALWQDPRLGRHFHIALQSGCDATLAAMGRRYTTDIYRETLGLVRGLVPDAAITTDLIVGFPGESDRDFDDSCRFIEACGLAAVHVFPYSPRPGTAASGMCPQVPPKDKRQRVAKALSLARTVARKFRESAVGSVDDVLWEAETAPGSGIYSGFTSNYLRVFIRSGKNIANQVLRARITRYHGDKLWTELV